MIISIIYNPDCRFNKRAGFDMIVCICNNIAERKIRQAVEAGMTTMPQIRESLGVGTCCGKCHACAKQVLRKCLDQTMPTGPTRFQSDALAA